MCTQGNGLNGDQFIAFPAAKLLNFFENFLELFSIFIVIILVRVLGPFLHIFCGENYPFRAPLCVPSMRTQARSAAD